MRKAISQRLSVGGQPQESDLEELKKDGVTTVVNLRVAGEKSPLTPTEERALAQKLGLQYHHLPISLDKLDATQVKELRKILRESQGPIYYELTGPEILRSVNDSMIPVAWKADPQRPITAWSRCR
jgi:uncharacterized protein (TIGR01244 family)